jgi:hypothetical protein
MRRLLIVAALLVAPASARAEGGPFGLGIIVGGPTGLSGEYKMGVTAIDFAVGLNLFDKRHVYVHGDFLFVLPDLLGSGAVGLSPYLGAGVFFTDLGGNDRLGIGLRAPFGLSLDFKRAPLQIFLELTVGLLVVPDVDLGIGGAGGFRYYF